MGLRAHTAARLALCGVALVAQVGCLRDGRFRCESNEQCIGQTVSAGQCEDTGYCSRADLTCDSGRRYIDGSGGLADTCVAAAGGADASPGSSASPCDAPGATVRCVRFNGELGCCASNHLTIAEAFDQAGAGDIIAVASGQYSGGLRLSKPVTLWGVDTGGGLPIVDAAGMLGFSLFSDHLGIRGFELKGGGYAGVLMDSDAAVSLDGLRISDCYLHDNQSAAIYLNLDATNDLDDVIIERNRIERSHVAANDAAALAIYVSKGTGIQFRHNCLSGNDYGLIAEGVAVYATETYWGSADGPSGNGAGSGDSIQGSIDYMPFWAQCELP